MHSSTWNGNISSVVLLSVSGRSPIHPNAHVESNETIYNNECDNNLDHQRIVIDMERDSFKDFNIDTDLIINVDSRNKF